jgi:hypothetical protein
MSDYTPLQMFSFTHYFSYSIHLQNSVYMISGDFMSVLQNLVSEAIPSHKCHTSLNMSPILNSDGDMGI